MKYLYFILIAIFSLPVYSNPLHDLANALDELKRQLEAPINKVGIKKSNKSTSANDQLNLNEKQIDSSSSKAKLIEAEGVGESLQLAKEDAIRNAVQKTVGSYVSSDLITQNDQIIKDKVISLSSGFVDKVEVISQDRREDGLYSVKVKANVLPTKLKRALEEQNIKTADLDSDSLFGEALTKLDTTNSTLDLWQGMLNKFPKSAVNAELYGKPQVTALQNDQIIMTFAVNVSWNEEYKKEFINIAKITGHIQPFDGDSQYLSLGRKGGSQMRLIIEDNNLNDNISSLIRQNILNSEKSLSVNIHLKNENNEVSEVVYGCLSPDFRYKKYGDNPFIHPNSVDLFGFNKSWLDYAYNTHVLDSNISTGQGTKEPSVIIDSLTNENSFILKLKKIVSKNELVNFKKADVVVANCVDLN
jgi:hypothetical protein